MTEDPETSKLSARELLDQTRELLGAGGRGDTPMSRLAGRTVQRARETGDTESEALALCYGLLPWIPALTEAEAERRIADAKLRVDALGVQRAAWLVEDLRAWWCVLHGRHVEATTIASRLARIDPAQRDPTEQTLTLQTLGLSGEWRGQPDDALRYRHRAVQVAEQSGRTRLLALACTNLGGLLTRELIAPEDGLPLLQRARALWAALPMSANTMINTAALISALDLLGEAAQAYQVFCEDLQRPGALDHVQLVRPRMAFALIGVGRLDEAEAWLAAIPAGSHDGAVNRYDIQPVVRLRLLCAQHRYAEARTLAERELDRPLAHVRAPFDVVMIHDHLREACAALGDHAAAAHAAAAAREACLPLVNCSARARYLTIQLQRDPSGAPALSAIDQRRLEAIERETQNQSVKAATKQVPQFLAHVVHELRNPIGGVMGMSTLLLMSDLDEKQRRYANALRSSGHTLLQLVNDVLDLAKIEHGQFSLQQVRFPVEEWLRESVEACSFNAQLQGLRVTWTCDPAMPTHAVGDPLRLRQVLANFLSNALKFTKAGQVQVRASAVAGQPGGPGQLRIEVQDTGKGISAEALARLFHEFVQEDDTISRDYGGTGLGLALCKQLMALMGGTLGATSVLGQGSTFWLEAPVLQEAVRRPVADMAND